jgi:hypothetical protein
MSQSPAVLLERSKTCQPFEGFVSIFRLFGGSPVMAVRFGAYLVAGFGESCTMGGWQGQLHETASVRCDSPNRRAGPCSQHAPSGTDFLRYRSASMITIRTFKGRPSKRARRLLPPLCAGAAAAIGLLSFVVPAQALIVGNTPGVVPDTTVADYPGWTPDAPGWDNVALNKNMIYLGDGWVLSARHTGEPPAGGITFQTPDGVQAFNRIPGSYYQDYGYFNGLVHKHAVSNPTSIAGLTEFTDLQLYRIDGDPDLPKVTIASQSPPLGSEVLMITTGNRRRSDETHWTSSWQETTGTGTYQGYKTIGSSAVKRWGTNQLVGPGNFSAAFRLNLTSTTGVATVTNQQEDVIAMATRYDKNSPNPFESQVIGGDSGGAVFRNFGTTEVPDWQLVGILNATLSFEGQPSSWAAYSANGSNGNGSLFANLSYYFHDDPAQDYLHSISEIMRSHPDYSHIGDVNLDGVVAGDGTGAPGSDDVTDFILGWGNDNEQGIGTIGSWRDGDLNRDGKTDVSDFLMLRSALNGGISAAVMATLFGDATFEEIAGSGVPEPATGLLASFAIAWLTLATRRRPPRCRASH